jgi:zinc ribbon protein
MSERKTKFCVNCGAEIDARAEICPKCGVRVAPPPLPQPGQAGATLKVNGKPKLGLIAILLGGFVVFIDAIIYLATGDPIAGVVGIIFVMISVYFARIGYRAIEKKNQQLYGMIPMFIGFIIMISTDTLVHYNIIPVLLGGFILTIGGVLISAGK